MHHFYYLTVAAHCVLVISCASSGYQATGVSDTWLDTPVRVSSAPKHPQSTLAQWKTGLPSAAHLRAISNRKKIGANSDTPAVAPPLRNVSRGNDREQLRDGQCRPGYWVVPTRHRHRTRRSRIARAPYVRSVESVGPSMVPQPPLPLSTRSFSGGPRLLPRSGVSVVPTPHPPNHRERGVRERSRRW